MSADDLRPIAAKIKQMAKELAAEMTAAINLGAEVSVEFKAINTSSLSGQSIFVVPEVSVAAVAREEL